MARTTEETIKTKERLSGPEALRCIAMLLVTVLHYLGKGGLLPSLAAEGYTPEATGTFAYLLESFAIVAVNCYILLSGYFQGTGTVKFSRLVKLYIRFYLFSVIVGLLCAAFGAVPAGSLTLHYFLTLFFPVTMGHYWFMTAYFLFYLVMPLVGAALRRLSAEQISVVLAGMLLFHCILKTILPFYLEITTDGYDWTWYFTVFLLGAYARKKDWAFLKKRSTCLILYVAGCLLTFARVYALWFVYRKTGACGALISQSLDYNQLTVVAAALGLFGVFLHLEGPVTRFLARIAPYTLGVYLFQENLGLRYLWQPLLGSNKVTGVLSLLFHVLGAVVVMFAAGVLADYLRSLLQNALQTLLLKTPVFHGLRDRILKVDVLLAEDTETK